MRWLAPLGVALAAAIIFTARATYDPDLFWHLAQGREVLTGHIVHTNLFSATAPTFPQQYTSWAFEALAAGVVTATGFAGAQVLQGILLAAALLVLYSSAVANRSRIAGIAVLLLSLFVLEPRAMLRPYLISWIGMGLVAWWLDRAIRAEQKPPAWPLVVMVIVWSNFHSESVFGAAMILAGAAAEWLRPQSGSRDIAKRLMLVGLACAVATLVTPYGIGMWRYLIENALVPQALRIAELQASSPYTYPAFYAYLATLTLLLASEPKRLRLWELVVVIVIAALGLRYIRFTPMIVFAAAPILASRIDGLVQRGWDRRAVLITVFAVMVVTTPASPKRMFYAWRTGADAVAPREFFSSAAIDFARSRDLKGPLFNSMNLGGYLEWMMPDDAQTFQDSRLQAYPAEHFAHIIAASESPEKWRDLVDEVDWAMVSLARPNEVSGVGKFTRDEWAPVFRDPAVEILVRRSGRYAGLAREFEVTR